jgi:hypothetical protein
MKSFLLLVIGFVLCSHHSFPQVDTEFNTTTIPPPANYYNAVEQDGIQYVIANNGLFLFSRSYYQNLVLEKVIPYTFTQNNLITCNNDYLVIVKSDSLILFDIIDRRNPVLLHKEKHFEPISNIKPFGEYFIYHTTANNKLKIIKYDNNSFSLLLETDFPFRQGVPYPYVVLNPSPNLNYYPVYKYSYGYNFFYLYNYVQNPGIGFPNIIWRQIAFFTGSNIAISIMEEEIGFPYNSYFRTLTRWKVRNDSLIYYGTKQINSFIWVSSASNITEKYFVLYDKVYSTDDASIVYQNDSSAYRLIITDEIIFLMGKYLYYSRFNGNVISMERFDYGFTGLANDEGEKEFVLYQNYPNPFNSSTTISWHLPEPGNVKISLYDLLGRKLGIFIHEYYHGGYHRAELDASRFNLTTGVYFYRFQTEKNVIIKKLTYLK